MASVIDSIVSEFHRYKALAEGAMSQLSDEELNASGPGGGNSVVVLVWHVSGNLRSRFTDFLTTDGEKPWRHRDTEFLHRTVSRHELETKWEEGWRVLFGALAALTDADLARTVTIRNMPCPVHEALHRSLAHAAYHVGQIVYLAKSFRGEAWESLSIGAGKSEEYNRAQFGEEATGLERTGALGDDQHPGALPHGGRQGHDEQGDASPASSRSAGEPRGHG